MSRGALTRPRYAWSYSATAVRLLAASSVPCTGTDEGAPGPASSLKWFPLDGYSAMDSSGATTDGFDDLEEDVPVVSW